MKPSEETTRISISIPASLQDDLDTMLAERGLQNRSQGIAEMIRSELTQHQMEKADQVMAGTITLFYDESKPRLQRQISDLQRVHVNEVISTQHILLEDNHRMEILVVQGPVSQLHDIVNAFLRFKGVKSGKLTLSPMILPPLHSKRRRSTEKKRKNVK